MLYLDLISSAVQLPACLGVHMQKHGKQEGDCIACLSVPSLVAMTMCMLRILNLAMTP